MAQRPYDLSAYQPGGDTTGTVPSNPRTVQPAPIVQPDTQTGMKYLPLLIAGIVVYFLFFE